MIRNWQQAVVQRLREEERRGLDLSRWGAFDEARFLLHLDRLWRYGLRTIGDGALLEQTQRFLLEEAPAGFFLGPATRGGKHHPRWHNGPHGVLINTYECCAVLPGMAWNYPRLLEEGCKSVKEPYLDAALASTIVSDSFKWDAGGNWTDADHLLLACGAWDRFGARIGRPQLLVLEGVRWHHGAWSPGGAEHAFSDFELLVHHADAFFAQTVLNELYDPR